MPALAIYNMPWPAYYISGAADVIAKWKDDADNLDFPYVCIASTDIANILTAKLLLNSGQPLYI